METIQYEAITVPCESGQDFVLPCWPVSVAPHLEGVRFVAHKSVACVDGWVVAEQTTGMAVPGADGETIDEAAATAETILAAMDKARAALAKRKQ